MSDEQSNTLESWLNQVADVLECSTEGIPVTDLLDVARDVAHNRVRPGAPTTTFFVGVALGRWEEQQRLLGRTVTAAQRSEKVHELSVIVQNLAWETA